MSVRVDEEDHTHKKTGLYKEESQKAVEVNVWRWTNLCLYLFKLLKYFTLQTFQCKASCEHI